MFEGQFFSSHDPRLDAFTPDLDYRVASLFPPAVDRPNPQPQQPPLIGLGRGNSQRRAALRQGRHLRLLPDELTGRGVACADGYRPEPGEPLALYFGTVVLDWPPGDFVLGLGSFRRGSCTLAPSVDAGLVCRVADPPIINAALFNHSCRDATVVLRRPPELYDCALPCAVAYAKAGQPAGCRLLWDYDGGARSGNRAFTVDQARSVALRLEGIETFPCACRAPAPCPRRRWFRGPS